MEMNYRTATKINRDGLDVGDLVWLYRPHAFGDKRRNTVEDHPYRIESVNGIGGYTIKNTYDPRIRKEVTRMQLVKHHY